MIINDKIPKFHRPVQSNRQSRLKIVNSTDTLNNKTSSVVESLAASEKLAQDYADSYDSNSLERSNRSTINPGTEAHYSIFNSSPEFTTPSNHCSIVSFDSHNSIQSFRNSAAINGSVSLIGIPRSQSFVVRNSLDLDDDNASTRSNTPPYINLPSPPKRQAKVSGKTLRFSKNQLFVFVSILVALALIAILIPVLITKKQCQLSAVCASQNSTKNNVRKNSGNGNPPESICNCQTDSNCPCLSQCSCTTSDCNSKFIYPSISNSSFLNSNLLSNSLSILNLSCTQQMPLFPFGHNSSLLLSYYISISPNYNSIKQLSTLLVTKNELVFDSFYINSKTLQFDFIYGDTNASITDSVTKVDTSIQPILLQVYDRSMALSRLKSSALSSLFKRYNLSDSTLRKFRKNIMQSNIMLNTFPMDSTKILRDVISPTNCVGLSNYFSFDISCSLYPQLGILNHLQLTSADVAGGKKQFGMFLSQFIKSSVISLYDPSEQTVTNNRDSVAVLNYMDHVLFDYLIGLGVKEAKKVVEWIATTGTFKDIKNISNHKNTLYAIIFGKITPQLADSYTMSLTVDNFLSSELLINTEDMTSARQYLMTNDILLTISYGNEYVIDTNRVEDILKRKSNDTTPKELWNIISK
eukprot:NODE_191_length_15469_cov_0.243071.p2 type:complete len:638 gc:universal NODE_191_length_15469_cov_0.243071:1249-3162(+)